MRSQRKTGYAYFISADPIEPLPEEKHSEQPEEVLDVKIIEDTEKKELTPGEALELADQIRRGRRPEAQGFARVKEAYQRYGGSELLSAICSILIKKRQHRRRKLFLVPARCGAGAENHQSL